MNGEPEAICPHAVQTGMPSGSSLKTLVKIGIGSVVVPCQSGARET